MSDLPSIRKTSKKRKEREREREKKREKEIHRPFRKLLGAIKEPFSAWRAIKVETSFFQVSRDLNGGRPKGANDGDDCLADH